MSHPILVTGASGGSQGSPGGSSRVSCSSRAPVRPSSINSMRGPTNSAGKVRNHRGRSPQPSLSLRNERSEALTSPTGADGLLEAATIFCCKGCDAGLECGEQFAVPGTTR